MAGQFLRDRIHVGPGVGLGVNIASQIVDVNRPLARRFVLLPELFLLLPDLFELLGRPMGLRDIGLLGRSKQQRRDEWDRDHRVLLTTPGCSVRWRVHYIRLPA